MNADISAPWLLNRLGSVFQHYTVCRSRNASGWRAASILTFCQKHPSAKQQTLAWHNEVAKAKWTNTQDIKNRYACASFVGRNRVVFNLRGNEYRLIVALAYRIGAVYIKFIGTHAEYDKVDAKTVETE